MLTQRDVEDDDLLNYIEDSECQVIRLKRKARSLVMFQVSLKPEYADVIIPCLNTKKFSKSTLAGKLQ